jgi:hypothetical protein
MHGLITFSEGKPLSRTLLPWNRSPLPLRIPWVARATSSVFCLQMGARHSLVAAALLYHLCSERPRGVFVMMMAMCSCVRGMPSIHNAWGWWCAAAEASRQPSEPEGPTLEGRVVEQVGSLVLVAPRHQRDVVEGPRRPRRPMTPDRMCSRS